LNGIQQSSFSNPRRQVKPGNQKNANKTGFHFSTADGFHYLWPRRLRSPNSLDEDDMVKRDFG
jgi:hypothetical protein